MSVAPSQVVVGYDGSDRARRAVDAARRIVGPGATVTVVYAHRLPPELKYYEFFQDVVAELDRGARETVESARDAFEGADCDVRYEAREGRPAEVLADAAREHGADLIVMGSRGHGRVRAAVGSAVLDLLHDAPCPVLVVPGGDEPDQPASR
jgi:nucleotide-binding universal stress UspA family protein